MLNYLYQQIDDGGQKRTIMFTKKRHRTVVYIIYIILCIYLCLERGLLCVHWKKTDTDTRWFGEYSTATRRFGEYLTDTRRFGEYSSDSRRFGEYSTDTRRFGEYSTDTRRFGEYSTDARRFGEYSNDTRRFGEYSTDTRRFGEYSTDFIIKYTQWCALICVYLIFGETLCSLWEWFYV